MNIYVVRSNQALEFRRAEKFEFTRLDESKGLVEMSAPAEGQYGMKPEERVYAVVARVLIGEGQAVILGTTVPTPLKTPSIRRRGVFVGHDQSWYVLQPTTRFERDADILKVFAEVQWEGYSEERMVALFWLIVGDQFGDESDADRLPREHAVPAPADPPWT